jgi:hypothetical protein
VIKGDADCRDLLWSKEVTSDDKDVVDNTTEHDTYITDDSDADDMSTDNIDNDADDEVDSIEASDEDLYDGTQQQGNTIVANGNLTQADIGGHKLTEADTHGHTSQTRTDINMKDTAETQTGTRKETLTQTQKKTILQYRITV